MTNTSHPFSLLLLEHLYFNVWGGGVVNYTFNLENMNEDLLPHNLTSLSEVVN